MQAISNTHRLPDKKLLFYFMAGWVVLNLLQASFLGVDADEAYYWLYARNLQWGYFDHPPMIALFIKAGETFGHGPLFTRLATVLFSAGTVYFGYGLLPQPQAPVRLYLLIFSSVILFHVYSFIATPDGPLLFFTTLFFYAYRKYLANETTATILVLALGISGLLYSKYHGVLPLFFTVLSNPKLLLKRSAWAVVLLVTLAFLPHLWWQYQHGWPTLHYHLSERLGSPYKFSKTGNYIAGQLFVWGLLTTIPALYLIIKTKRRYSTYERAHLFTFWGVFLFFLFSSFQNNIQLHWTLVAGPSFVVLLYDVLYQASAKRKKNLAILLSINFLLLLLARVVFIIPGSPVQSISAFKALAEVKTYTAAIHRFAQGRPVVFTNTYRLPALYLYQYPGAKAWGYNTVQYRKTQFNIFSDGFLNNKAVCIATADPAMDTTHPLKTTYNTLYLFGADSFKAVNALKLTWENEAGKLQKGAPPTAQLTLLNTGSDTIATNGLSINYTFMKNRDELYTPETTFSFQEALLPPGYKKTLNLPVQLPAAPGNYRLVFSMVQHPLAGNFASPLYKVRVE